MPNVRRVVMFAGDRPAALVVSSETKKIVIHHGSARRISMPHHSADNDMELVYIFNAAELRERDADLIAQRRVPFDPHDLSALDHLLNNYSLGEGSRTAIECKITIVGIEEVPLPTLTSSGYDIKNANLLKNGNMLHNVTVVTTEEYKEAVGESEFIIEVNDEETYYSGYERECMLYNGQWDELEGKYRLFEMGPAPEDE